MNSYLFWAISRYLVRDGIQGLFGLKVKANWEVKVNR